MALVPKKSKVTLKSGAKFTETLGIDPETGKPARKLHTGPCVVEMTDAQKAAFADMIQKASAAPKAEVESKAEVKAEAPAEDTPKVPPAATATAAAPTVSASPPGDKK